MCDENAMDDMDAFEERRRGVTRREFGTLAAGVGMALVLPAPAGAEDLRSEALVVTTPDGRADAYYTRPATGKRPGVLMWPMPLGCGRR